jgi:hypothetical protein
MEISQTWPLFCLLFGVLLLATFIMKVLSWRFYTMDVVVRKFSIVDLEFAATPEELVTIINGIYLLPPPDEQGVVPDCRRVERALKAQIWVDYFLFMPAAFGSIFLLCMKVAEKMEQSDQFVLSVVFWVLAWLQFFGFVLDGIENAYLLRKIKPGSRPSTPGVHLAFQWLEVLKWGSALVAAVCAVSAILYFWLSGFYSSRSTQYLWVVLLEFAVFVVALKMASAQRKARRHRLYAANE